MKNKNTVFYKCNICDNMIGLIEGDVSHILCCGKEMQLLEANSEGDKLAKHVPVYEKSEDEIVVKIGKEEHPMDKEHYIMWVAQVSDNQTTRIRLYPEQDTTVRFKYIPGSIIYAYCNKHGLWKAYV